MGHKEIYLTALIVLIIFISNNVFCQSKNRIKGIRKYEIGNHLGNVLATATDRKMPVDNPVDGVIDGYEADVFTAQDYYAFGMVMSGRETSFEDYRFGFNGMEKDDAKKGLGNSYTTEFRQFDPRIGRWLSIDPLSADHPWQSPYVAFDNNPILFVDPFGLKGEPRGKIEKQGIGLLTRLFKPKWYKEGLDFAKRESKMGYDVTLTYEKPDEVGETGKLHIVSERRHKPVHDFTYAFSDNTGDKVDLTRYSKPKPGHGVFFEMGGNSENPGAPAKRDIGFGFGHPDYTILGRRRDEGMFSNNRVPKMSERKLKSRRRYNKKHGYGKGHPKYKPLNHNPRSWFDMGHFR